MNLSLTKISLGIAIFLSSSLNYVRPSFAVSFNFGDRKTIEDLEKELFWDRDLLPASNRVNSNLDLQQNSGILPELNNSNDNLSKPDPPSSEEYITLFVNPQLNIVIQTNTEETEELFSNSEFNISIQTEETEETEKISLNLLQSFTEALANLEFETFTNESVGSPEVAILPQVAYGDIYRGLYDFEVNLTTSSSPRSVVSSNRNSNSNSAPQQALISQESISGYENEVSANSSIIENSYNNYNNYFTASQNNSSAEFTNAGNVTARNNSYYQDLSEQLKPLINQNINVFPSRETIEEELGLKYVSNRNKFKSQKDPKLVEIEETLREQQEIRDRQRAKLQEKLKKERAQRAKRREKAAEEAKKKREKELSTQRKRQQQIFNRQQRSIISNF